MKLRRDAEKVLNINRTSLPDRGSPRRAATQALVASAKTGTLHRWIGLSIPRGCGAGPAVGSGTVAYGAGAMCRSFSPRSGSACSRAVPTWELTSRWRARVPDPGQRRRLAARPLPPVPAPQLTLLLRPHHQRPERRVISGLPRLSTHLPSTPAPSAPASFMSAFASRSPGPAARRLACFRWLFSRPGSFSVITAIARYCASGPVLDMW